MQVCRKLTINLAEIYSTYPDARFRNGQKAIEYANKALLLFPNNPMCLNLLACAKAEIGDYKGAVDIQRTAIEIKVKAGASKESLTSYEEMLTLFRSNKPYREEQ